MCSPHSKSNQCLSAHTAARRKSVPQSKHTFHQLPNMRERERQTEKEIHNPPPPKYLGKPSFVAVIKLGSLPYSSCPQAAELEEHTVSRAGLAATC